MLDPQDYPARPMTEDAIEAKIERVFDRLDRMLMAGEIQQYEYDAAAERWNAWTEKQYDAIALLRKGVTIDSVVRRTGLTWQEIKEG